jgi:hypothetical protein
MAAKSSKAKSKRRPTAKSKTKRAASSPLLVGAAGMRPAKLTASVRKASDEMADTIPFNPALMMLEIISRALDAYVELPGRLAQCRSPMDLWAEQARFAQRVFSTQRAGSNKRFCRSGTGGVPVPEAEKESVAREPVPGRSRGTR